MRVLTAVRCGLAVNLSDCFGYSVPDCLLDSSWGLFDWGNLANPQLVQQVLMKQNASWGRGFECFEACTDGFWLYRSFKRIKRAPWVASRFVKTCAQELLLPPFRLKRTVRVGGLGLDEACVEGYQRERATLGGCLLAGQPVTQYLLEALLWPRPRAFSLQCEHAFCIDISMTAYSRQ